MTILSTALGFMLLTTGCATVQDYSLTYKLWNNAQLRRFAEPAPDPRLALFASAQSDDVLVQYDEVHEQSEAVQRRAYFLRENDERIRQREKPRFVNPQLASSMAPVQVCASPPEATNSTPKTLPSVAMSLQNNGQEFLLHLNGASEGPYSLPTYLQSNANFVRVALTPFAVAGDTVMVGLVASLVAAYAYATGTVETYPR